MMKSNINKNLIWMLLIMLVTWACEKEYVAPTSEPNDVLIQTSFGNLPSRIQVNGDMDFIDLSRGVTERTWSFPDGVVDILESDNDLTSSESVVKAAFMKSGTYEVSIQQTFAGNVFKDGNQTGSNTYDSLITVTVLDSIQADFSAQRAEDNSILVNANGALNEIIAGREVIFQQQSVGQPTDLNWIIEGKSGISKSLTGDSVVHKFSSIDTYKITLTASSDLGSDTIQYLDYITVVPSSDPVDLIEVYRAEKNEIVLVYSREMQDPFNCDPAAFTIDVTNKNASVPVSIRAFKLDPVEKYKVIIELNEELYNSDEVFINYDASIGNLITTDLKEADSFQDARLDFKSPNIMATNGYDVGFETSADSNWPYGWWGAPWDGYTSTISDAMSKSGEKSMLIEMIPGGGAIFDHRDDSGNPVTFPVESGKKYQVGYWIYMEELGNGDTGDGFVPDFRFYPNDWTAELGYFFDAAFPTGKWTYVSAEWNNAASEGELFFFMRGYNASSTAVTKFYMDDLTIFELEERP